MHILSAERWRVVNARARYNARFEAQFKRDLILDRIRPFDSREFLRSKGLSDSELYEK